MQFLIRKIHVVIMAMAFGIWIWLFRFFWSFKIGLFADGISYYYLSKKWLDNLLVGVIPFWTPFENFGIPYAINLRFIGEYNPLWLVAGIPYALGVPYDKVYFFFLCFVYGLALIGFYLIALRFFKSRVWASYSFLMLLFSSMCMPLFCNFCIMLLALPIIWLIYFLWSFYDSPQKKSFCGSILCLMVIAVTYMPFYFLIFIAIVGGLWILLYPAIFRKLIDKLWEFLHRNKKLGIIAFLLLFLSLLPGAIWFVQSKNSEFINVSRGMGANSQNSAAMSIDVISAGGVIGPITIKNLFSGLDKKTESISYFLISIWAYIIVVMGMITIVNRRLVLLSISSVLLIFLVLTNATSIHRFLYDHVFFFKLIRNIFYLLYFALPMIVLFVVEQLRLLTEKEFVKVKRWLFLAFVVVVHGIFLVWLRNCGDVVFISYLTLCISFIFFILFGLGFIQRNTIMFYCVLGALIIVQPAFILSYFNKNLISSSLGHYRHDREYPLFLYKHVDLDANVTQIQPPRYFVDKIGFEIAKNEWTGSVYPLIKNLPVDVLRKYILTRFVAYDRVQFLDDRSIDWKEIGKTLFLGLNTAYVSDKSAVENFVDESSLFPARAQFLRGSDPQIQIKKFTFNEIKFETNFQSKKFLVYNDAFHSGWRASIDGKFAKIIRSNVGFKGLWIAEGKHLIAYQFGALWEHLLAWILLLVFYGFCGIVLFMYFGNFFLLGAKKNNEN